MRLEFINRVKEGDVVGKNILTGDGKILLRSGVTLTNTYINKLYEIGVFYIYVKDVRLEDVMTEDEHLEELKQVTMSSMSNIMKNIHSCNGKALKEALDPIEELVEYIIELGDVNKSLYDIQTYDNYTYIHSLDTCVMASFLGISNSFKETPLKELGIGAILHDIGKTKVPYKIISKQGRLTDEEFSEIKKHPIYGKEILSKNMAIPQSVIDIVEQHHERVDGKGYPNRLLGSDICNFSKIVSICDVYDAVSNDRCYRKKFSPNDAYELILSGSGTYFDEDMVLRFKETFAIYPLGSCVRLSNGEEGYIIKQNKGFPDRPVIRILYDSETKRSMPIYEIDLMKNPNLVIKSIV